MVIHRIVITLARLYDTQMMLLVSPHWGVAATL